jgi:hypothetical protein
MIVTIACTDDIDVDRVEYVDVDTDRYKVDEVYRCEVHEKLDIADGQEPLDWDYLLATEEQLEAMGEKAVWSTGDYATEEAAMQALDELLTEILEEDERNAAAESRSHTACAMCYSA